MLSRRKYPLNWSQRIAPIPPISCAHNRLSVGRCYYLTRHLLHLKRKTAMADSFFVTGPVKKKKHVIGRIQMWNDSLKGIWGFLYSIECLPVYCKQKCQCRHRPLSSRQLLDISITFPRRHCAILDSMQIGFLGYFVRESACYERERESRGYINIAIWKIPRSRLVLSRPFHHWRFPDQ